MPNLLKIAKTELHACDSCQRNKVYTQNTFANTRATTPTRPRGAVIDRLQWPIFYGKERGQTCPSDNRHIFKVGQHMRR